MLGPTRTYADVCRNSNCQTHTRENRLMNLQFRYTDKKNDVHLEINVRSPSTIDILQCTKDLLDLLFLDHIPPEDVQLVGFGFNKQYKTLKEKDKRKRLETLGVTDGCILYFEPTSAAKPPTPTHLTILGPDELKIVEFKWFRERTTLRMLLEYIIKEFSLESVSRRRIFLSTIVQELRLFEDLDQRLSELNVYTGMVIRVQIDPPLSPTKLVKTTEILVKSTVDNETFEIRVPPTETINELMLRIGKRYEDRRLFDFTLRNEANEEISITDFGRSLQSIGVKPGQTLHSAFRLRIRKTGRSSATTEKEPSSSITSKDDKVTVICKFPSSDSETTRLSVTDTFDHLMKYVDSQTSYRRLVVSKISSDTNCIHLDEDRTRCLADLGLRANDVIVVDTLNKPTVRRSIVSSPSPLSAEPDRSQRPSSSAKRPIGLDNLGNSCYMNSAFQCLAHLQPLTNFFLRSIDRAHASNDGNEYDDWNPYDEVGEVTGAYADLLWNLWRSDEEQHDGNSFKPSRIKERMGEKDARFGTQDQHDAQEFMTFFLEIIHKELKEKNKNEKNTIIKQLFFGEMTSTIRCMACHRVDSTTQPVSFLSIPLDRQERTFWINFIEKNGKSRDIAVDVSMNGELGHVVEIFAEKVNRSALFYYILAMLPDGEVDFKTPLSEIMSDELIFMEQEEASHNQRPPSLESPRRASTLENCLEDFFSPELLEDGWTCQQERCRKKTTATKQLQLVILPKILIIQFKRFSHENGLHQKIQTFVDYPIEEFNLSRFLSRPSKDAIYDLIAVCNHTGSVSAGHYIAYARRVVANKSIWYRFDDSSVTRIKSDDYKYEIISKYAYLLFYIRRDA